MKPIPENDPPLRELLKQWKMDEPLPPRFRDRVWRRIERAELESNRPATTWFSLLLQALAMRRIAAVAYVTAILAVGLFAGYWRGQEKSAKWDHTLASRYVETIDPFQKSQ